MTITRRTLHDEIIRLDGEIAEANEAKRDAFETYREQMAATGLTKSEIADEIAAFKTAYRKIRRLNEDPNAVAERDALVDEIVAELRAGTDVATRSASARDKNGSVPSLRGGRAGHTPMRAGRGDNAPLKEGTGAGALAFPTTAATSAKNAQVRRGRPSTGAGILTALGRDEPAESSALIHCGESEPDPGLPADSPLPEPAAGAGPADRSEPAPIPASPLPTGAGSPNFDNLDIPEFLRRNPDNSLYVIGAASCVPAICSTMQIW